MKIFGLKRLVLNNFLCCDLLQYQPAYQLQHAAMNLYSISIMMHSMDTFTLNPLPVQQLS